jgi:AAA ATPase domain
MGVHRVLRPTGAVGRLEVADTRRLTPVVGRDGELERLADAWRRAEGGHGAIVHVTGEAGIGKSRLVRTLVERLGERVGTVQTWQCSAHRQSTSLYPVIRLLERLLGLDTKDRTEPQLDRVERAVRGAGLDPVEAVPLLADLLSLPDGGAARGLTPLDARTAILRKLESLLVGDPLRHPLLLLVEDLHWGDPTTVELLGRIAMSLPDLPVLCVLAFRPEFEPPWTRRQAVLELEVGPLASEEVRAMATAASGDDLDPTVLEWVDAAADGVPLFVEEMVKMLERGGEPDVAGRVQTAVPPTLEGLLTERLDRLPELGEVIDVAAILGREFDRSLLVALEPLNGSGVEPAVAQLAAQDVLRPVPGARRAASSPTPCSRRRRTSGSCGAAAAPCTVASPTPWSGASPRWPSASRRSSPTTGPARANRRRRCRSGTRKCFGVPDRAHVSGSRNSSSTFSSHAPSRSRSNSISAPAPSRAMTSSVGARPVVTA